MHLVNVLSASALDILTILGLYLLTKSDRIKLVKLRLSFKIEVFIYFKDKLDTDGNME